MSSSSLYGRVIHEFLVFILDLGVLCVVFYMVVSFVGEGNRNTWRK